MQQKMRSATMVFVNNYNEILTYLRDDKPTIECPGMWDIPGGGAECDETPEQTIVREMNEELPGIPLGNFRLYRQIELPDRVDSIFWTRLTVPIEMIWEVMTEGEKNSAAWTNEQEAANKTFGFDFGVILKDVYGDLEAGLLP